MKNLKVNENNILKLVVGIVIFIYIIFGTSFLSDASGSYNNVKKNMSNSQEKTTDNITVTFLDIGQGDAIIINSDNKYVLIDSGSYKNNEKIIKYLNDYEIKKFEYVIATHPDEDHIGNMSSIIKSYEINNFLMPDIISTTKTFSDMLDQMKEKNLKYDTPNVDDIFYLNDAKFEVISIGNNSNNSNDSSIILKLIYHDTSFLFMADASINLENKIINKDIKSDVIKLGHHGSKESTSSEFIKKVDPKYAVISVGENNIYNHPSKEVIDLLNLNHIKIFRTDIDGNITFTSDGFKISVTSEN